MPKNEMRDVSVFIDSTTILYSNDLRDAKRRKIAQSWLDELTIFDVGRTNLQVLNEVTNVLIKKASRFDPSDAFEKVDAFSAFGSKPIDSGTVVVARALHQKFAYSWWDCLLLASAIDLGCSHFLSEDLQDGQVIEGLTIVDPFAHSPDRILVSR